MTRDDIEDEASERALRRREAMSIGRWAYDNAIKVLMAVVGAAWAVAFAAWASNVSDAKDAYVQGQQELTDAIRGQQDLRERVVLIKDRQDRVILVLDELERRVRVLETRAGR